MWVRIGNVDGNADYYVGGSAATVESSIQIPQTFKNGNALWPSDSIPGNISEETQNTNSEEYMHPHAHFSSVDNSQGLELAQVPISSG